MKNYAQTPQQMYIALSIAPLHFTGVCDINFYRCSSFNKKGITALHIEYRDQLYTYNEITKHFYLGRREFPLPNKKLTRSQSVTLRLLQTNSYPNPWRMKHVDPDYDGQHVCEHTYAKNEEKWDKGLKSASLEDQLWVVQEAREAAESFGLSVPTWEMPSAPGT